MGIGEAATLVGRAIKPPGIHASPRRVMAWRWAVAIITGTSTAALTMHILLACGYVPSVFAGFARSDQLASAIKEMRADKESRLEASILDMREKQCRATGTVRSLYTSTLAKLRIDYQNLTGRAFILPDCEDFGTKEER